MTRKLDRGELQDRLPDYVHGALSADEHAQVEAALASDAELAAELDLIRAVRSALAQDVAAVDSARVVAALPRAVAARSGFGRTARLRIAAAIATIAVGGASLAVVERTVGGGGRDSLVVYGESTLAAADAGLEVSFGYDLSALDEADLEALLQDLEREAGLPPAEPRRATPGIETDEGDQ